MIPAYIKYKAIVNILQKTQWGVSFLKQSFSKNKNVIE